MQAAWSTQGHVLPVLTYRCLSDAGMLSYQVRASAVTHVWKVGTVLLLCSRMLRRAELQGDARRIGVSTVDAVLVLKFSHSSALGHISAVSYGFCLILAFLWCLGFTCYRGRGCKERPKAQIIVKTGFNAYQRHYCTWFCRRP